jgi:hypothetical protein
LETVANRTAIKQNSCDVKEVLGAGKNQVRKSTLWWYALITAGTPLARHLPGEKPIAVTPEGGPASEQDPKRRLGNYDTAGEHSIEQPDGKQGPN